MGREVRSTGMVASLGLGLHSSWDQTGSAMAPVSLHVSCLHGPLLSRVAVTATLLSCDLLLQL